MVQFASPAQSQSKFQLVFKMQNQFDFLVVVKRGAMAVLRAI
jgi:hypothetical protein